MYVCCITTWRINKGMNCQRKVEEALKPARFWSRPLSNIFMSDFRLKLCISCRLWRRFCSYQCVCKLGLPHTIQEYSQLSSCSPIRFGLGGTPPSALDLRSPCKFNLSTDGQGSVFTASNIYHLVHLLTLFPLKCHHFFSSCSIVPPWKASYLHLLSILSACIWAS